MYNFVVLCGGSGSRLWPKSRAMLPKQLLSLTYEKTMLQNTILRIQKWILKNQELDTQITIICNKDHTHIVDTQIVELNLQTKIKIICEPMGRDSAPAICIASLLNTPNDNTFILPCDHVFDDNEFVRCCTKAIDFLETSIITFGIKPNTPETGYGYINIGINNKTEQFIEKPSLEKAKEYLKDGNYFWNAGIFAFKNKNIITCFEKYAHDILDNCRKTIENTNTNNTNIITLAKEPFITCRAISIDYAIMEFLCKEKFNTESDNIVKGVTLIYDSVWNDIGSFSALYDQLEKDKFQNVLKGDFILTKKTSGCYIESEKSMVATIGIENLIIVDTSDVLLICNKDNTQDVKQVVDILKKENREEILTHKKVFRPWGYYENIHGDNHSGFKVKKITVYPGKRLSLQSHNYRSEHWVIVKGNAKLVVEDDIFFLNKAQHVYIPVKTLHRIENVGEELLEFTETQIGDYLGEDDIIREP